MRHAEWKTAGKATSRLAGKASHGGLGAGAEAAQEPSPGASRPAPPRAALPQDQGEGAARPAALGPAPRGAAVRKALGRQAG